MIRILGISGSPRKSGTEYCVKEALKAAESIENVETKFITVRGKEIKACIHCDACLRTGKCIHKDDAAELINEFFLADGFIIGSPVYDMGISSQLTALFNRFRMRSEELCNHVPRAMEHKVAVALAVGGSRNGGQEVAISTILNFCMTEGMIVVGGEKWQNTGACLWSQDNKTEGTASDQVGLEAVMGIGRRVAEITSLIRKGLNK